MNNGTRRYGVTYFTTQPQYTLPSGDSTAVLYLIATHSTASILNRGSTGSVHTATEQLDTFRWELGWCFIYYYDYNLWPRVEYRSNLCSTLHEYPSLPFTLHRVEYRSNLCFTLHERTSLPLPCFGWSIGRTYAPLSMKPGS